MDRFTGYVCKAVSEDRIAPGKDNGNQQTCWHTPASRATASAQPQFMCLGMRGMTGAYCSERGAVDWIRCDAADAGQRIMSVHQQYRCSGS
jgi:hypothetical protein